MADLIQTDPNQILQQQEPAADALGATRSITPTSQATVSDVGIDETVAGQLKKLISEESPVLQQARERSKQYATGRGLQNSSIAAQAGEQAVISTATPIASQDAATVSARRTGNLAAVNAFGQQQQQFGQQQQLINQQTDASSRLQSEQGTINSNLQAQGSQEELTRLSTQGDINERLQALGASQDIQKIMAQGTVSQQLQSLQTADDLVKMAAQEAITTRLSELNNTQEMARLQEQGNIQERLQTLNNNFASIQADLDRGQAIALEDVRFQNNQALVITEYAQRMGLSTQEAQQDIEKLNQQHVNTLAEIAAQAEAQGVADAAMLGPKLQAQYLEAVNNRMSAGSAEIQAIYSQQGLSSTQQTTAVNNANARMRSDLAQLQAYYSQSPSWDSGWGSDVAPVPPAGVNPTTPASGTGSSGSTGTLFGRVSDLITGSQPMSTQQA